ncbi:hypothetical protein ACGC1H_003280 [Rhizoctonia solani]
MSTGETRSGIGVSTRSSRSPPTPFKGPITTPNPSPQDLTLPTVMVYAKHITSPTPNDLTQQIQAMNSSLTQGFGRINACLDRTDRSFDLINRRRDRINKCFDRIDGRFDQIDKRFDQLDKRFDDIGKRFDQMDKHFTQINRRAHQINERCKRMVGRFDRFKDVLQQSNQLQLAMSLNARAVKDSDPLFRLPLPNGGTTKFRFPATIRGLRNLSGSILSDLIVRYEIVDSKDIPLRVEDRRKLVARHIGSRLFL